MSKPVLVLVMSETCGACQKFKTVSLSSIERFNTFDYYQTAFNWINIAYGILVSNMLFNIKWK